MSSTPIAWAKLAANFHSNRRIRKAGHLGRTIYIFVLCSNAGRGATGTVPATELECWYLAEQLQITPEQAQAGIDAAVAAGLISIEDGNVVICGWDAEWGKRQLTEAERKRVQRARSKCPDTVRTMSGPERDSPDCPTGEEREEREERPADAAGPLVLVPVDAAKALHQELAEVAIGEINRLSGSHYDPGSKQTSKDCKAIAKIAPTVDQVRAVIAAKWSEWRDDGKMRPHFKPAVLLRPSNFAKYLEDLAARTPSTTRAVSRGPAEPEQIMIDGKIFTVPASSVGA